MAKDTRERFLIAIRKNKKNILKNGQEVNKKKDLK